MISIQILLKKARVRKSSKSRNFNSKMLKLKTIATTSKRKTLYTAEMSSVFRKLNKI